MLESLSKKFFFLCDLFLSVTNIFTYLVSFFFIFSYRKEKRLMSHLDLYLILCLISFVSAKCLLAVGGESLDETKNCFS